jgi:hypothetical protein
MVFDNYDDVANFENIQTFIPDSENGCILITSKYSDSLDLATGSEDAIELLGLAQPEALQLLFSLIKRKQTDATVPHGKAIVKRLIYHPLVINQAGSYIKTWKEPLDQFIYFYNRQTKSILDYSPRLSQYWRSLDASQKETSLNVFTTWELSFQQLLHSSSGPRNAELLTLFAFFDCKDITEQLFSAYCERAQQYPKTYLWPVTYLETCLDNNSKWISDEFRGILVDLTSLSLLQS